MALPPGAGASGPELQGPGTRAGGMKCIRNSSRPSSAPGQASSATAARIAETGRKVLPVHPSQFQRPELVSADHQDAAHRAAAQVMAGRDQGQTRKPLQARTSDRRPTAWLAPRAAWMRGAVPKEVVGGWRCGQRIQIENPEAASQHGPEPAARIGGQAGEVSPGPSEPPGGRPVTR